MRIRTFDLADYAAASALWATSDGMGVPPRAEVERKLRRDPQLFLVADDGGQPPELVGVVMGSYDGRRGWAFRLAVAPGHRRRGVARALVEELERRFLDLGVTSIRVLAVSDNAAAARFWDAVGYERFDEVVLYSKELASATPPLPLPDGLAADPC